MPGATLGSALGAVAGVVMADVVIGGVVVVAGVVDAAGSGIVPVSSYVRCSIPSGTIAKFWATRASSIESSCAIARGGETGWAMTPSTAITTAANSAPVVRRISRAS